jgi:hypothetical protein
VTADAVIAELQAVQDQEQHQLADRQTLARRTRVLTLGAVALSVLRRELERAAVMLGEREQALRDGRCWSTSSPGARW